MRLPMLDLEELRIILKKEARGEYMDEARRLLRVSLRVRHGIGLVESHQVMAEAEELLRCIPSGC